MCVVHVTHCTHVYTQLFKLSTTVSFHSLQNIFLGNTAQHLAPVWKGTPVRRGSAPLDVQGNTVLLTGALVGERERVRERVSNPANPQNVSLYYIQTVLPDLFQR